MIALLVALAAIATDPPATASAAAAAAADTPPDSTAPAKPAPATITVTAKRPASVQKIDRRVYTLPNDAKTASSDGFALLRGLPAITVGLDDSVQLLGTANVTILVDNKPPPDGNAVLRSLHGADIDHIEVMTNPSAEYAPDGTGGIINIVLKKKHRQGASGTVLVQGDSFGGFEGKVTHKLVSGPWSFDTNLVVRRIAFKGSGETVRRLEQAPGGAATGDQNNSAYHGQDYFGMVSEAVADKLNEQTTATLSGWAGANRAGIHSSSQYTGLTPDFASFAEQGRSHERYDFAGVDFSIDREGEHESGAQGESLKFDASANWSSDPDWSGNALAFAPPAPAETYQTYNSQSQRDLSAKLDYVHPMPGRRILSAGASVEQWRLNQFEALDNAGAIADFGPSYGDAITGRRTLAAAYASLQQPIGKWTLLPALRLEYSSFRGVPQALPSFSTRQLAAYPSAHLSRPLGKFVDVNLSYARRVDRPDLNQLNPFTIIVGTTSAVAGNPALRNQTTDAYEANFAYHRGALTASAILYDRETAGVWSIAYSTTPASLTLTQPINAGHKSDRGAEFDVNTPLAKRLKLTASINLFDSRTPVDSGAAPASIDTFRATGNATLDWTAPEHAGVPGDDVQWQLSYQTARQDFERHYSPQLTGSLSASHAFSKAVSAVLTVDNMFGVRNQRATINALLVQQSDDNRTIGPRFTIKLVRNFGK